MTTENKILCVKSIHVSIQTNILTQVKSVPYVLLYKYFLLLLVCANITLQAVVYFTTQIY